MEFQKPINLPKKASSSDLSKNKTIRKKQRN